MKRVIKNKRRDSFTCSMIFILTLMIFAPVNTSFAHETETHLNLNSEAVIMIDGTTGEPLYTKNEDRTMYPASITKIVTGIIAIEAGNLDELVTISEEATQVTGTSVYLLEDEEITLKNLIKGMLINSGNDASTAIAEHFAGSEEAFAKKMNEFVTNTVGVTDTNFANPHGLYHPDQYTTAEDMAKITQYALENETFREIVAIKEYDWVGEGWETTLYNHHDMVRQYDEVFGVKNGYVSQSGYTLVTSALEENQIELIAVTLNASTADQAYEDTKELLEYGLSTYQTNEVEEGTVFEDDQQNSYELEETLYFTSLIDEEWSSDVDNDGNLIVQAENGETLYENKLNLSEDATVQTTSTEEEKDLPKDDDDGHSMWWLYPIPIVGLALLALRIWRKGMFSKRIF
ncbi:D-alanyl-D-alanine carboxypeptidase family protein [Alkalibacillus aidingensis]|uniref:D-alanyl-D-alanine carboxypeptidase family protein n=1 Tax=Alkalibacillus aidingensis TaxID=2747607 RepID=UPI001CB6E31F|nr:D-alanyl-D-alanine carboxypeptidase family protein [Alkalibacillus aidingensis]